MTVLEGILLLFVLPVVIVFVLYQVSVHDSYLRSYLYRIGERKRKAYAALADKELREAREKEQREEQYRLQRLAADVAKLIREEKKGIGYLSSKSFYESGTITAAIKDKFDEEYEAKKKNEVKADRYSSTLRYSLYDDELEPYPYTLTMPSLSKGKTEKRGKKK